MAYGKILLVSDGGGIFPALDRFFSQEGYEVITVSDPREAVTALKTQGVQLIISRLSRNGFSLLKAIRKANLKAILLKGEHEVNSPVEAYHLEGKEPVFIPCGWPGLKRLVNHCLSD